MRLNLLSDKEYSSKNQTFKFKTNARKFKINFDVEDKVSGFFPHVGVSAREGITLLYRTGDEKGWQNIDAFTNRFNTDVNMTHIIDKGEEYEVLAYGPILSKLSKLYIELPENTTGKIIDKKEDTSILIAGGMYSFGIGCTTSSMMFSNILGRKVDATVENISFNNNDFLKKTCEYIKNKDNVSEYTIGILEIDNYIQDKNIVEKYLKETIKAMKSICKYVICWYSISNYTKEDKDNIKKLLNKEISSRQIDLLDISHVFNKENKDICTYSDKFINDTGNMMIYKEIEPIVVDKIVQEIWGSF